MTTTVDVHFPFAGQWLTRNSPADRVPSHGTALFGTAQAIDFVPVDEDGRSAPFTAASLVRPESPQRFVGFGRPILAPVDATVIAIHDGDSDHRSHRGLPSVVYALTQRRRLASGWKGLAGNHVLLEVPGAVIALCHLQRGSIAVRPCERVRAGDLLGRCGNSGNSMEPHLHVQAIDRPDVEHARPVRMTFRGSLPRSGEIVRGTDDGRTVGE